MKFLDNILNGLGLMRFQNLKNDYVKRDVVKRYGSRVYQAAQMSRYTNDWLALAASIDQDIKAGLRPVRNRARDLVKNNDYAKGYMIRNKANIIGPEGFILQMKIQDPDGRYDDFANSIIEKKWEEWCRKEYCTMSGMWSFVVVQWIIVQQLKRDGEIIARMIMGPGVNKFGFSLELLETDDLDETYNDEFRNGNVVIMGVEYNEWRKPVAFWMKKRSVREDYSGNVRRELQRVPAEEIIFGFDPEHPKQSRGMSHMVQSMLRLKMVDGWEEASLINARATAGTMGLMQQKQIDVEDQTGDDVDENGDIITDFEAGSVLRVPYGYEYILSDPKYPHEQHGPFLKTQLRGASTGLGISYNSLANDLEGVNFSSLRSGLQDERDNWMVNQVLFREIFLIPLFSAWLKWSLFTGEIPLPYSKYDKFNQPEFQGRRWSWVDPEKDVNAAVLAIENGLSTRTREAKKQGLDIKDIFTELAAEEKLAKDNNLTFGAVKNEKNA